MGRRGYVIAFVLVLLIAGIGGFLGGRLLLERLQSDLATGPGAEWTPVRPDAEETEAAPAPAATEAPPLAGTPLPVAEQQPTRRPTPTVLVVAAPEVAPLPETNASPAPEELPTSDVTDPALEMPASEVAATETPRPTPSAFPFALAQAVRYSTGDCPGTYALGRVTDRTGNPLANVRLNLVDEFGNGQSVLTKSGQADAGRYDFPMFGPPRRFYMTVVDEGGRPLSQRVEVLHNMPPHDNTPCRWVDWRGR